MTDADRPGVGQGLWQLPLAQFRNAVAERALPGCGAVAAVTADLAVALIVKALRVTARQRDDDRCSALLDEARALLGRPGAFADDDVAVFREVLKDQHDDRLASSAARQACAVPLATAHACIEALGIAERAVPLVDPALRCDVEAAVLLLVACVDAVLLNVDADLQGLDDAQARARVQVRAERLAMAVERHRQRSV
ncbi:cyclodeaminase/cyclohydrolase family protein [Stutzerimonas stutzeri]|jgi:formiminotetrahydrofolate cyclodeaminase|uniref:cyclodeaminase/cyclohydrolase family protein n=1 Tax=Stutzerimonas stutzeri TaxID=316 RepID=UPI000838239A|nr:cyclodeaminase/cyclohydrolase family protein [Stutzerimonas stutzeri]HAV06268.1 methenyltetrahydrofolate cyclohydrolase [Pseudomonas sp.]MBO0640287.1 cyclodeaminase/cyclohydrolase family protein [Stutzerimonas stutzeri]MDH1555784.1 cyclodeaminase/cyclohydrolase family protein [Stutzerimonas stutzeri]OCX55721.1 methenyltetrahydrofolate cyclohydrolase [Stutzerimonas stutzeri]RAA02043.1 methenyltetrahydrofolate cyclohydrolase [Stutzerimonas stutzeri]